MRREVIDKLTNLRAMSSEYTETVKAATNLEIRTAAAKMYGRTGNKRRLAICEREMKCRKEI